MGNVPLIVVGGTRAADWFGLFGEPLNHRSVPNKAWIYLSRENACAALSRGVPFSVFRCRAEPVCGISNGTRSLFLGTSIAGAVSGV